MTNAGLFKLKIQNMSVEELARVIDDMYFDDNEGCDWCAYDNKTCTGEDCVHGITVYLKREVQV